MNTALSFHLNFQLYFVGNCSKLLFYLFLWTPLNSLPNQSNLLVLWNTVQSYSDNMRVLFNLNNCPIKKKLPYMGKSLTETVHIGTSLSWQCSRASKSVLRVSDQLQLLLHASTFPEYLWRVHEKSSSGCRYKGDEELFPLQKRMHVPWEQRLSFWHRSRGRRHQCERKHLWWVQLDRFWKPHLWRGHTQIQGCNLGKTTTGTSLGTRSTCSLCLGREVNRGAPFLSKGLLRYCGQSLARSELSWECERRRRRLQTWGTGHGGSRFLSSQAARVASEWDCGRCPWSPAGWGRDIFGPQTAGAS